MLADTIKQETVVNNFEKTIVVPVTKVERFEKEFKKLQRLVAKFDVTPLTYFKEEIGERPYTVLSRYNRDATVLVDSVAYTITGSAVSVFNTSHELVASISYDMNEFATIVKLFEDMTEEIQTYVKNIRTNDCEHCNQNRARKHLYIFREIATGNYVTIGKSCTKEFLDRALTPAQLEAYYTSLLELENCGTLDTDVYNFVVDEVLVKSIELTEKNGFTSSREGIHSTAFHVKDSLAKRDFTNNQENEEFAKLVDKHRQTIEEIREYFQAEKNKNVFHFNINQILQSDMIEEKNIARLTSAYVTMKNARSTMLVKPKTVVRNFDEYYECEVGTTITVTGTIVTYREFESKFGGMAKVITFVSDCGKMFTWFTSSKFDVNKFMSKPVKMVATVKNYNDFEGKKSVVVNRPSFSFI